MVYGPQSSQHVNRIHPVDPDPHRDEGREGRKRNVLYQGRTWTESMEEELPVQPGVIQQGPEPAKKGSAASVYADRLLLEKAHKLFAGLTTLEEKVAQLCFLTTEAIYDAALQHEVELLVQTWQVGGVLFTKGDYRRQAYLVERYQEISKTPLLVANDFLHGLSFYLQGDALPAGPLSEQRYLDLGKAVMAQNKRLGVHIQFDRERGVSQRPMSEAQARAFRKGIRKGQGIVGKEKAGRQEGYAQSVKGETRPFVALKETPLLTTACSEYWIQETIGFKTGTFFDASKCPAEQLEEQLLKAFNQFYDLILFSDQLPEGIRMLAKLVRSGKIREETLDRHVLKALIIKSLFFG